jgi:hypothetical protein
LDYQDKLARFLENHDEPRAAATFGPQQHAAAAVLTFLSPGLRFFHQGQLDGRRTRVSPHLGRAPDETDVPALQRFYERLLDILRQPAVRDGAWRLLECGPAFDGNGSSDAFIASMWQGPDGGLLLVAVNYAGSRGQCYVRLPVDRFADGPWRLEDLLSDAAYVRDGRELRSRGLYLDVPAWHCHVFRLLLA